MDPSQAVQWGNFGQMWVNVSFSSRGFPLFMAGYCDECGLRDCHDPGCQQTREALTHPDESKCNCVAIRSGLGASERGDLIGGHEPDCVCTNEIHDWGSDD